MLVKCKAGIYDSKVDPVMVILSHADKQNIAAMHNDCTKYCQFPDSYSAEEIKKWMSNVPDRAPLEPFVQPIIMSIRPVTRMLFVHNNLSMVLRSSSVSTLYWWPLQSAAVNFNLSICRLHLTWRS